jgi:UPF0755 protein
MILRIILIILLLVVVAAAALGFFVFRPYSGFGDEVFVDIPRGTSTQAIADLLEERGVLQAEWQFLAVRMMRPNARLQAGEYRFTRPASPWEVFDRIRRGDVHHYQVSIPEGYNIWEIAEAVGSTGIIKADDFLAAAKNPALIRDIAPEAVTLEGYLFPDTYRFTRQTSAEALTRFMTDRFRSVWSSLDARADVHRVVTLASLIEKETGVPEERPLVSSVIQNRIAAGMPLQIDPTVIYAARLADSYRGTIYQSDLQRQSPYNTYRVPGIPPGPIANPGRGSLQAALNPANTRYIFFVAKPDGSGGHVFSEDYSTHLKAVQEYRRGLEAGNVPPAD